MSTIAADPRDTTRGAGIGSPDVVSRAKRPVDPPRIGPLPEPSLLERLRRGWSVYALVPAFDHEGEGGRAWKRAAWAAVALHLVVFAGIVVVGRLALARADDGKLEVVGMIDPKVIEEETTPDTPETDGSDGAPTDGARSAGSSSDGGASNTGPKPATAGQLPPPSPTPPIPAVVLPPSAAPLVVSPTADSSKLDIPPPTGPLGIPIGAPPEGPPSFGDRGGASVGNGAGDQIGPGKGTGPGGNGEPGSGGHGPGTGPATAPGGTPQGGSGLQNDLPLGTRDHGIRIARRVRPVIPPAMSEAGTFGTVTLRVTVAADGTLISAEPINGLPNGGTQAALAAVRKCTFTPAIRGGKYVTESTQITISFTENGT